MYIDTHAHLFEEKIKNTFMDLSSINKVLVPTYKLDHFDRALDFCLTNKKFYLAVGVHPEFIDSFDLSLFRDFIKSHTKDIYAIGEIGLDSSYPRFDEQCRVFVEQLRVAQEYSLPVSVHLRGEVFDKFFEIMDGFSQIKCALHCFCGGDKELQEATQRGYYISFATNITYKGNRILRRLASQVPSQLLLIETDSPNIAPSGFGRGTVNTSENIHFVAEVLAKELGKSLEEIAAITSENAIKLFGFMEKK
ncbi:MAG: TatD family hydrolase [Clostridia bacterium]|nr:TatD family hydrolase [Clostridia bacterium]